jgi:hypothetical protein
MSENRLNNVNVDLNRIPPVKCHKCGCRFFKIVYLIKKISALVSPTGKETLVPIQIFACDKCNEPSELFKNLNDTEEISHSEGESLGDSVQTTKETPKENTNKLFIGG